MTFEWAKSGMVGETRLGDGPPAIHYFLNSPCNIILN